MAVFGHMGLRFRKSFKIAPGVKLNLSKSGIGMSAGVRGARVGVNSRGTYSSVGIPGTGVYAMSYHSSGKPHAAAAVTQPGSFAKIPSRIVQTKTGTGLIWVLLFDLVLFAVHWIVAVVALGLTAAWYFLYLKKQSSFHAKQRLRSAQTAYASGNYQKAADDFTAAYAFFPADKAIALLAASSYSQVHQYDKAANLMAEYIVTHPEDIEMQKALARWYNEVSKKDDALQILQSLDVEQTKDSGTLLLMADILSGKGLYTTAIEVLKRAPLTKRTLTPDLVEVIYALGLLYEKVGDTKHARSSFERVYAYDASFKDVAERVE